jgi:hypothetical protein
MAGTGGVYLYAHHQGDTQCISADSLVAAKQQVKDAQTQAAQQIAQAKEELAYEQAQKVPVAPTPVVRVHSAAKSSCPSAVPKAGANPSASTPAFNAGAAGASSLVLGNADAFIRSDVQRGHDCDETVSYLQALLKERQ